MKSFFPRLFLAIKVAYLAFKNPKIFDVSNFKMLASLYELILKVATENKPYISHLAMCHVHKDDGNGDDRYEIASIWAGAGAGAEPLKRIQELAEENAALKMHISQLAKQLDNQPKIS